MRIASIECFAAYAGWRVHDFLKVTMADGVTGWSEFSRAFNGPGVVESIAAIAPRLIGQDPRSPSVTNVLRESRRASTLSYQACAALSNALLDVRARALGVPVSELLGGRVRERVRVYWAHCGTYRVSHADLMEKPAVRSLDDIVDLGREVVARGFSALKTNLLVFGKGRGQRYSPGRGTEAAALTASPRLVRALADQLNAFRAGSGPDMEIMVDLGSSFRVAGAIRMARGIETYDPAWIEVELGTVTALAQVRAATRVPLAGGERLRAADYLALLREHAVDVPIVDVLFNGLPASVQVAATCEVHDANVAVHNCYSPLATLMGAAFCAVVPNIHMLELDVDGVPWQNEFVTIPASVVGGHLVLPDGPGWGTEVNEAAIRAHALPATGSPVV
jgi:galactonate dehydratase